MATAFTLEQARTIAGKAWYDTLDAYCTQVGIYLLDEQDYTIEQCLLEERTPKALGLHGNCIQFADITDATTEDIARVEQTLTNMPHMIDAIAESLTTASPLTEQALPLLEDACNNAQRIIAEQYK